MQTVIPPLTGPASALTRDQIREEMLAILREPRPARVKAESGEFEPAKRPKRVHGKNCAIVGNVTIPYYRTTWRRRRKLYVTWSVRWKLNGQPFQKKKPSREEAHRWAEKIAAQISNGQSRRAEIDEKDLDLLVAFKGLAERCKITPQQLLWELSEYKEKFPAIALLDAGRAYQTLNPIDAPKTVQEVFTEMIPARKRDGKSKNTVDDWRSRLGRFSGDFGPRKLSSVTGKEISDWLRKLTKKKNSKELVSNRTRNNYRGNLGDLFGFARESGYVPKTCNPLEDVRKVKNEPVRIEVFTPEEMVKLLGARVRMEHKRNLKTIIPFLAIGGFGGVRHEEMCAPGLPILDWREVDFEKHEIRILPEVARKIGHDRILPMQPNLEAWLKRYAKPSGPICELANANNALQETAIEAKIVWKDNGLRKSFISYRLAVVKNIGQVADEAGTSPERIRHNYKKTFPKREGLRWFAIWPTSADILQVEFGFAEARA